MIGPVLSQFIEVGADVDRMKSLLLERCADDVAKILDSCRDALINRRDDCDDDGDGSQVRKPFWGRLNTS